MLMTERPNKQAWSPELGRQRLIEAAAYFDRAVVTALLSRST